MIEGRFCIPASFWIAECLNVKLYASESATIDMQLIVAILDYQVMEVLQFSIITKAITSVNIRSLAHHSRHRPRHTGCLG